MRVHLIQSDIVWEDKDANHARVRDLVATAGVRAGDLVLLPEMFDTGFSINVEATADTDGRSAGFLQSLAAGLGAYAQGSVTAVLAETGRARNRSLTFGPDGTLLALYDKAHPFSFGRENERFDGGTRTASFDWQAESGSLNVFPTVCYDLRFPELFRAGSAHGAEALTVIANWPEARVEHWRTLLRARAIENLAFVFAVNRAGADPFMVYPGRSAVIAPDGEVLAEMGADEGVASVEIDPERVSRLRSGFPALLDRKDRLSAAQGDLPEHVHNGLGVKPDKPRNMDP